MIFRASSALSTPWNTLKKSLVLLFPWALIAGILDYRFHQVYWPSLNRLRAHFESGAQFDFFSIFTAFELVFIVVMAVDALSRLRSRTPAKSAAKPSLLLIAILSCFVGGAILQLFVADSVQPVIKTALDQIVTLYLLPIATAAALWHALRASSAKPSLPAAFLRSFLCAFGLLASVCLLQWLTGFLPGDRVDFMGRLVWPYVDPFAGLKFESANWLSYVFAPVVLLAAVNFRRMPVLATWSGLTAFFVVLLSQSYTGLAILFLLLALVGAALLPRAWKIRLLAVAILTAILSLPFLIQTQKFQVLLGHYSQPNSVERRAQIYQFTSAVFEENWWRGIGPGNYQSYFRAHQAEILTSPIPERELPPHPHNLLLAWWSDLGILGLLGGLLIYAAVLSRLARRSTVLTAVVVAYFLAHGLLDTPYASEETAMLFWTFAALMLI